jgi:acyl-CoA reductase-like NAD-dependent aldehyde dehydrogenase
MTSDTTPTPHESATAAAHVEITERTISIRSPLTGEEVGTVSITEPENVERAVAASREAFGVWGAMTHAERKPFLREFTKVVMADMDHAADVIHSETGKDRGEAMGEIVAALTAMDYYSRKAAKLLKPKKGDAWPFLTTKGWTEYHPMGVAGIITPWNYPFYLAMLPVIQAIAAGCTAVLKPSEVAPLSGQLVETYARKARLPEGVVNVIHGAGDTGAALVRSSTDVISFTGSTEVGKHIHAEAAHTLKPLILEMGGKDAMIVLEDADVKQAAHGAVSWGCFNAGQTCVAVERIYVVEEVYDDFVSEAKQAIEKLDVASGGKGDIGPLISPPQVKIIEDHVADAVNKGATILHGGRRVDTDHGVYFEPTLMVGVNHTMDVMQDETFGPVVPIMKVRDDEEALAMANDSRFGLHGSVWTKDSNRGEALASRMKTGTVAVNDHVINFFVPSIVLGGVGESGVGGQLGEEGIKAFTIHKSITSARLTPTTKLMGSWLPRKMGPRYWKGVAKSLFGWRR